MASLKTSLFNLTETVANAIKVYKQQGAILAEDSKQAARINICVNCDKFNDFGRCNMCGCFMNLKVRLEASKCPANRW